MKYIDWDGEKNEWLIINRGVSFELFAEFIAEGNYIDIIDNHSPYEHQRVFIIVHEDYVYEVPFVEDDEKVFLKTIIPSRDATKKYLQ